MDLKKNFFIIFVYSSYEIREIINYNHCAASIETLIARCTFIWFDPSMNSRMSFQLLFAYEFFLANLENIGE